MLQNKDIKNLAELSAPFVRENRKAELFAEIVDILRLGKFHGIFATMKVRGISALQLLRILICLPFLDQKSVWSFSKSSWNKFADFGKDAYYRL